MSALVYPAILVSLALVLGPVAKTFRGNPVEIVALVKPQFEVGRGEAKGGVVRDPEAHRAVLERIVVDARRLGLGTRGVVASPIVGPEGNREFLVYLGTGPDCAALPEQIAEVAAG